jgi:WD40 repeat protein
MRQNPRLVQAGHCLFEGPLPIKGICDLVGEYAKEFEGVEVLTRSSSAAAFTANLLAVLTDGRLVSSSKNDLIVWDNCVRKTDCIGHTGAVCALIALTDGKFASGSLDCTVRVWNSEGECVVLPTLHYPQVGALALLDCGKFASSSAESIFVWDASGICLHVIHLPSRTQIYSLFHLGDNKLAACAWGGIVSVYDGSAGSWLYSLHGHSCFSGVSVGVLFGGRFATCGRNHEVMVWTTSTGAVFKRLFGHAGNVKAMLVLPDGTLVTGSDDHTIRAWDVMADECLFELVGHTQAITALALMSDGRLASSAYDSTVKIWNLDTLDCALTIATKHFENSDKSTNTAFTSIVQLASLPNCTLAGSCMGGSAMSVWA